MQNKINSDLFRLFILGSLSSFWEGSVESRIIFHLFLFFFVWRRKLVVFSPVVIAHPILHSPKEPVVTLCPQWSPDSRISSARSYLHNPKVPGKFLNTKSRLIVSQFFSDRILSNIDGDFVAQFIYVARSVALQVLSFLPGIERIGIDSTSHCPFGCFKFGIVFVPENKETKEISRKTYYATPLGVHLASRALIVESLPCVCNALPIFTGPYYQIIS